MKSRGNPVMQEASRKVISQNVAHPSGSDKNFQGGTPGKLRSPAKQNSSYKISQKVGNPSDGKRRP